MTNLSNPRLSKTSFSTKPHEAKVRFNVMKAGSLHLLQNEDLHCKTAQEAS